MAPRKPIPHPPAPVDPRDPVEQLRQAAQCISDRAAQRDLPEGERSMARAVATFNTLTGHELSERDGWVFMNILKLSRAQNNAETGAPVNLDDYIDGAAYMALAGEVA